MSKQNKKTSKKVTQSKKSPQLKAFAVGSHDGQVFASVPYTLHDFKNALLLVSLTVNLVVLIVWLIAAVSSDHALAIARIAL